MAATAGSAPDTSVAPIRGRITATRGPPNVTDPPPGAVPPPGGPIGAALGQHTAPTTPTIIAACPSNPLPTAIASRPPARRDPRQPPRRSPSLAALAPSRSPRPCGGPTSQRPAAAGRLAVAQHLPMPGIRRGTASSPEPEPGGLRCPPPAPSLLSEERFLHARAAANGLPSSLDVNALAR